MTMTTIINAYSVYDKTAETFATPFFAPSDEIAKRNFRFSLKKFDAMFVQDFELYFVGYFDQSIGKLIEGSPFVVDTGLKVLSDLELEKKNSEVKQ